MADADRFDGFEVDRYEATLQGWFEVQPDDVSLQMQADRTVVMVVMARSHKESKDIKKNNDVVWQRMLKVQDAVVLTGPMREQALAYLESQSAQMSFDWDADAGQIPVDSNPVNAAAVKARASAPSAQVSRNIDSETGEILGAEPELVDDGAPRAYSTVVERAGAGPEDHGSVYPDAHVGKDAALRRFLGGDDV